MFRTICITATCLFLVLSAAHAQPESDILASSSGELLGPVLAQEAPTADARETAVALNYCRAAFHRIRRYPAPQTLREEQEKILNNLNLSRLADPEVIQLYTSVLDEINQMGLADKEQRLNKGSYQNNVTRKLTWDAVALGADLATGQVGNAVRTGANSWWDYRSMTYQRDSESFKIEKNRLNAVVQKSSQFLDTFWKLAQKKKIPDRWLVRGDDLDALEVAMRESDAEVRLRVLKRMEPFMEAYPPYWYYVGRTQQELGHLPVAINTYGRLENLGRGHFRKDDMLATALANRAAIEEFAGDPNAVTTARVALDYSTDVWEANLICARVLQRQGDSLAAEDAILRNLDTDIETSYSRVFLASLYIKDGEKTKLAKFLASPEVVSTLPAPILLQSASLLGTDATPDAVIRSVVASLQAYPRQQRGGEELMVRASSVWQLHIAQMRVYHNRDALQPAQVVAHDGYHDLRFTSSTSASSGQEGSGDMYYIEMTYPDKTILRMGLSQAASRSSTEIALPFASTTPLPLKLTEVTVNEQQVAFHVPETLMEPAPAPASPMNPGGAVSPLAPIVPPVGSSDPQNGKPVRTETAKPILDYLLPPPLRIDTTPLRPRAELMDEETVVE